MSRHQNELPEFFHARPVSARWCRNEAAVRSLHFSFILKFEAPFHTPEGRRTRSIALALDPHLAEWRADGQISGVALATFACPGRRSLCATILGDACADGERGGTQMLEGREHFSELQLRPVSRKHRDTQKQAYREASTVCVYQ
jgi:hypothetical protein